MNEIISGHADPVGEAPWVMSLVTRIDKSNPPTRTAVCAASATAVATFVTDERATSGEWAPQMERWLDGRIRKHSRRARAGAAWDKVQNLPGVTVSVDGAEVRAFVPCPTDAIPRDIAKLQLAGSELEDPEKAVAVSLPTDAVVISLCPEPFLPLGKAAAAAGHAAQLATMEMAPERLALWASSGYRVVLEQPVKAWWDDQLATANVSVVDAGLTEVEPGTITALAHWS
jgi:peptidyl-tRNA hydrolase